MPHAGRDYPLQLRAAAAVPVASMLALEDRHADDVALAARIDETLFVQRRARAWIDLNRGEDERDPMIDDGARPIPAGAAATKLRSGLGLVPRRSAPGVAIWSRRLGDDEVRQRIAAGSPPLSFGACRRAGGRARAVRRRSVARRAFDAAATRRRRGARGDRRSLRPQRGRRLVHRLEGEVVAAGIAPRSTRPILAATSSSRHGRPDEHIHAIQIEIDRRLYLDPTLTAPGKGLAGTAALLRRMIDAATDELLTGGLALAAE